MSRSRSQQLHFKNTFRSISMTSRSPSYISSNSSNKNTTETTINRSSQMPKRYQGNIILPKIQLSDKNHNKMHDRIKKNDLRFPPSNSSEENQILSEIQKHQIQKYQNLETIIEQALQMTNEQINDLNKEKKQLKSKISIALNEKDFQSVKQLRISLDDVTKQLSQSNENNKDYLNKLILMAGKIEQLKKTLQLQRQNKRNK